MYIEENSFIRLGGGGGAVFLVCVFFCFWGGWLEKGLVFNLFFVCFLPLERWKCFI